MQASGLANGLDPHVQLKLDTVLIKHAKRSSNPYALSHYLRALGQAEEDVKAGASLARALYDNYQGRLLSALENCVGLPLTYGGGGQDKGRPV